MAGGTKLKSAYHPWVSHYPAGLDWRANIDLTPVSERVLKTCANHPDRVALDFLGAQTRYRDLGRTIEHLSTVLQSELGIKKGTRVALLLPNTPYYVYFYFAVLRAGGIIVNCNPLYAIGELTHIVASSGAEVLVTLDLVQTFEKADALAKATDLRAVVVCPFTACLPFPKNWLFRLARGREIASITASSAAGKVVHYASLTASHGAFQPVTIEPLKDIAVQQYTGGTTGIPKGAMLTHANVSANVSQIEMWGGDFYRPGKKLVAVLPFFHIFAMTACLNISLANGLELLMLPRFELKALLDLIKRKRPEYIKAVPTLIHALCSSTLSAKYDLSCLEFCISGGAPLSASVREEFEKTTGGIVVEGYGLTECSPVVCCGPLIGESKSGSIGQPLPGTDVRFADVDHPEREVGPGDRGELQVRGPQVMAGYFEDAAASAGVFVDGWFRTGDVGYLDNEGHAYLVDRIKDIIICSGFNVYPRNIEDALDRHPDVEECTVIGVPDDYRGEAPVAFVKLKTGSKLTATELKSFLTPHLSKIEMPKDIVFRAELPKTLVGKLSKKELREDYAKSKENAGEPD